MDILEVTLLSNNIPATLSFYRDVLELPIISETSSSVSFRAGMSRLTFSYVKGLKPVYHFAFNIPCNHLESVINHLQQRTEIIPASDTGELIADFKSWNARSVYFNDNNGNILECIARMDLDNQRPEIDAGSFVLNISEIGFVTENVPAAEAMLRQSGIPLYSKGPQLEDFSVLGDENGLVILKDIKDGWMPNNLKPEPFESSALLRQDGLMFRLAFTDRLGISRLQDHPSD